MKSIYLLCCFVCYFFLVPLSEASDSIKIGAIFAKSGEDLHLTTEATELSGVRYAVEELNQNGGLLGKRVELIEFNNYSNALGSKAAAKNAVKAGVVAVIGAAWSSNSLAIAPILQKAKIPMITPISTNPKVTLVGDYIFRACIVDDFQGRAMASFAIQELNAKKAVMLTNTSELYSIGLANLFRKSFEKNGGSILWEGDYSEGMLDFEKLLTKVHVLNPDIIFVPGSQRTSAYIIKQARKMGISQTFLGGDAWNQSMYEYAGKAIEGSYYSTHWHMEVANNKCQQFIKAYEAKQVQKEKIESEIPLAYDAVMILADAIKRSKSLHPPHIRDALAATKNYSGVTGNITLDKNGDPIKSVVILKFENGESTFHKTIEP